jgi:hypothetical protein
MALGIAPKAIKFDPAGMPPRASCSSCHSPAASAFSLKLLAGLSRFPEVGNREKLLEADSTEKR